MAERNRMFTVRMSSEEYRHLEEQARQAGMKMEPFVRRLIAGCKLNPRPPDSYIELSKQLAAIGNNLNQIAFIANSTGKVSDENLAEAKRIMSEVWLHVRENV